MIFLNARVLCTSSIDGNIRLWDTSSGICETIVRFGHPINLMKINGIIIEILYNKNTIATFDSNVSYINHHPLDTSTWIDNIISELFHNNILDTQ